MAIKAHALVTHIYLGTVPATNIGVTVRILGFDQPSVTDVGFEVDKTLTSLQFGQQLRDAVKQWTITNLSYSYGLFDTVVVIGQAIL